MRPSLVSVAIPCFNAERWLAQPLDSALNRSWPRCEIFVVDDRSADRSSEVAASYAKRGGRLLYQQNRHTGVARTTGWAGVIVAIATYKWLRLRRDPVGRHDYTPTALPVFFSKLTAASGALLFPAALLMLRAGFVARISDFHGIDYLR